jgi:hypothetical protein
MSEQPRAAAPSPHELIAEALRRIEAAYPALLFADERATDEAGESFRRAVRIVQFRLRRSIPLPTIQSP